MEVQFSDMPAKHLKRPSEEGVYCRVYNSGVDKRIIFNDENDYKTFLGFLKDYLTAPIDPKLKKKTFTVQGRTFQGIPHQPKNYFNQVELIACSLLPNRFDLLLHQRTKGAIEGLLRSLCTRYSIYFNKKYKRTGTLFEGPYKSIQLEARPQKIPHTNHIHNPFKENNTKYSSYPNYLSQSEASLVKPEVVLALFEKMTSPHVERRVHTGLPAPPFTTLLVNTNLKPAQKWDQVLLTDSENEFISANSIPLEYLNT